MNTYMYSIQIMKNCSFLLLSLLFCACSQPKLESKIAELESALTEANEQLAEATAAADYQPGLCHSVFFWLREDLTEQEVADFVIGLQSLKGISAVKQSFIGPPSATEERGVVDRSYSYALLLHFDDLDDQDAYQIDPIHLKFIEDHQTKWTKVIVYDSDVIE